MTSNTTQPKNTAYFKTFLAGWLQLGPHGLCKCKGAQPSAQQGETARTTKGKTTENMKQPELQVKGKIRLNLARISHAPK